MASKMGAHLAVHPPPRCPLNGPSLGSAETPRTCIWVLVLLAAPINRSLSLQPLNSQRALCSLMPTCSSLCGDGLAEMQGESRQPRRGAMPTAAHSAWGWGGEEREGRCGGGRWSLGITVTWRSGVWVPHTAPRG